MKPIVIVGAGLAGLTCAVHLHRAGIAVRLVESDDHIGGRVWSDTVDGFTLDRGFQVFLDSYSEPRKFLDYTALRLHRYAPGAFVVTRKGFKRIVDPLRAPSHLLDTLRSGAFTLSDMCRVLKLRLETRKQHEEVRRNRHRLSTLEFLRSRGFSDRSMSRFFKPFFSGVFLEGELETPADMFAFVFQMFSTGFACIPEQGMRAIPCQLAAQLPEDAICLNARVAEIDRDGVRLVDGTRIEAGRVVLATDCDGCAKLLGLAIGNCRWRGTTTLCYRAPEAPSKEPTLFLNGTDSGTVNSVVIPTNVAPSYSSDGRTLILVSILDSTGTEKPSMDDLVRTELRGWFGESVAQWEHFKTYSISRALPVEFGDTILQDFDAAAARKGVQLAGDFLINPSIDAAMRSGREAAERIMHDIESARSAMPSGSHR